MARRIVQEIQLIHEDLEERKKNFRKGCNEQDALVRWATLCGASVMDEYLFRFICDEIRLQNLSVVSNWQKTLCRMIESMLENGMPMESLRPRPDFHEEMRQARNAEEALLAVLNACARVTKKLSEIKWHSTEAFGIWISRLQGQRIGGENVLAFNCLSFLNLQNCILICRDFIGANFRAADLQGANLQGANLTGAYLQGAYLRAANLQRANLTGANLTGANLQGAYLRAAYLQRAALQEADLHLAHLEEANLTGTILEGQDIATLTKRKAQMKTQMNPSPQLHRNAIASTQPN